MLTNEWLNLLNFDQESIISEQVRLLERSSQDKGGLSGHGRVILELCEVTNIKTANGRIFQDENIGTFTFHESRGSSVVDYLLVDVRVWDLIENFAVHHISCYSDNCATEFSIRVRQNSSGNINNKSYVSVQNDCEIDSFKLIRADNTRGGGEGGGHLNLT